MHLYILQLLFCLSALVHSNQRSLTSIVTMLQVNVIHVHAQSVQKWASSGFFLKGSGFCVTVRACMYLPPVSDNGQCVSFRKLFKAFVAWPLIDVTKIM